MKKQLERWIAILLVIVLLPWQECYTASVYGMEDTTVETEQISEEETVSEGVSEHDTKNTQESVEEQVNGSKENEVTAPIASIEEETISSTEAVMLNTEISDEEADFSNTAVMELSEDNYPDLMQMDIVNNLIEVILQEGKGELTSGTIQLQEDVTIEGGTEFQVYKEDNNTIYTINLNGHSLIINGDFYHPDASLSINGGSLIINGNYICEKYYVDEEQNVYEEKGNGYIFSNNDKGYIYIAGDYIHYAPYTSSLVAGKLEVEGNFYLRIQTYFNMDFVVHRDAILYEQLTNGNKFTCEGNVFVYSGITNSSTMFVEKSIIVKHGFFSSSYGNTTINENFIIEDNDNPGYIQALGNMFIGGDLLDYSTAQKKISEFNQLEIQGDINVGSIYFDTYDNLILSGDKQQYITVRDSGQFGNIENRNSNKYVPIANRELDIYSQSGNTVAAYIFDGYGYVKEFHLTEDTVVDGNLIIKTGTVYNTLNLYNLTVTGDLVVENRLDSQGKITVLGNMYIAKLNRSENTYEITDNTNYSTLKSVEVFGDLYINTTGLGNMANLKLHGNLSVLEYHPHINTLELCGAEKQSIRFDEKKQQTYFISNLIISNTSEEPIIIEGNPVITEELTANEHEIDGSITLRGAHICDEVYNGDIKVLDDTTKLENITINGNVELQYNNEIGENVTIHGDLQIHLPSSTNFIADGVQFVVDGNVEANSSISVQNSSIEVKGNINCSKEIILKDNSSVNITGNLTAGKIVVGKSDTSTLENCADISRLYVGGDITENYSITIQNNASIEVVGNVNCYGKLIICDSGTMDINGNLFSENIEINNSKNSEDYVEYSKLYVDGNISVNGYFVILKKSFAEVKGNITTNGYLYVLYGGDLKTYEDICVGGQLLIVYYENNVLELNGNISAYDMMVVGSEVVINGNVDCTNQFSFQHYGTVQINGNLTTQKIVLSFDEREKNNLYVNGDLNCDIVSSKTGGVSNFTLEAFGDITVNEGLRLTDGSMLVLSGADYQKAYFGADSYFENVIVRNTSEEGLYINQPVSCGNFTNETNCKITYGEENGVYGWTLRQDSVIYGDLKLIGGELNLNGYNLTVTGNLYQNNGSISSTSTGKWGYGGKLSISENYYYQPQDDRGNNLTEGTMEIGGNLIQNAGTPFVTGENYTVRFSSYAEQHINAPDAFFGTLELDNKSNSGIIADSVVSAKNIVIKDSKKITGESVHITDSGSVTGTYPGDLTVDGGLEGNVSVDGTLTLAGEISFADMEVNAANLQVNQPLHIDNGYLVVDKNMTIAGEGILYMENADGKVVVGGNYTAMGKNCEEPTLTAGTLEIKGNFVQRKNNTFFTGEDHTTILSGRTVQSITVSDEENSIFNILVVKKNILTGYIFTNGNSKVYREIVYDYVDVDPPVPVSNLKAEDITTTGVTITYDAANDDVQTLGYEIYRDGERIAVTMDLSYSDKGLIPGQEYTYEVYPYDIYNNVAAESEKLKVSTVEDITAPNAVDTLFVASRSGSSILLEWGIPYDDSAVAYYEIYRNGELFVGQWNETQYRDTAVECNTEYRYEIYAVDLGGNRSEQGNMVLTKPVMPRVLSVTPQDRSQAGGKYVDIVIQIADDNNLAGGSITVAYRKSEGEYLPVSSEKIALERSSTTAYKASVRFDLSQVTENGDYEFIAEITDNSGNKTEYHFCYYIDVQAPDKVELTEAAAENQTVALNWEINNSGDCVGYYVYRKDEESDFAKIATLTDRFDTTYTDKKTETDKIYTYGITAYDGFGNESEMSDTMTVTVDLDREAPVITSLTPASQTFGKTIRMEVHAEDNIAVTRAAVYYRENETSEWINAVEKYVSAGYAYLEFTVDDLTEGEYDFMVKVYDAAGNESEGSVRHYTIDCTGLKKPVITQTGERNMSIQLIWEFEQEEDFSYFVVERKILNTYIEVGREYHTLGYTVTGLQPETQYTFRVTAYDIYGNAGEPSEEITAVTCEDTVNPMIQAELGTGNYVSALIDLKMKATDDVGIRTGKFSFSYDGENFGEDIILPGNGNKEQIFTAQYQVKSGYEGSLWIRYEAEDTSENVNEEAVCEFIVDCTPPENVENFQIVSNLGSIELTWKQSTEEGITYNLYRAVGESEVYKLIAENLDTTAYNDCEVKVYESYTYRIEAVDLAGNRSIQTNPVMTIVSKDTIAPVVRGIGPAKSLIGNNPAMSILVTDNYRVSRVRVSCRAEDGEERLIAEYTGIEAEMYQEFTWNTEGLDGGTYTVIVLAWDEEGNTSSKYERTYELDTKAPDEPVYTVEGGHFKNNIFIDSSPSEDFSYYEILRREIGTAEFVRIGTTTDENYTDGTAEPFVTYVYAVVEYDKAGNSTKGAELEATADNVDVVDPRAFLPEYMSAIEGKEIAFDGTMSTDNVGVVRYQWNMGDGSRYTDSVVYHAYEKSGRYMVSLTVWDGAGNSDTTTATIYVRNKSKSGDINISIYGEDGKALGGAYVFIESADGDSYTLQADSMGKVCMADEEGNYEISVYSAGYMPECQKVEINKNQEVSLDFRLVKDEVIKGEVNVRRLTVAELVAKGVDLSDPANYNTFSFTIDLYFKKYPIPTKYEVINCPSVTGGIGGGSFSASAASYAANGYTHNVYVQPMEAEEPVYVILTITESIRWLKDIYEVSAEIVNSADEKFSIEDMKAEIELPEGLSFAGTYKEQNVNYPLGTLASGQSKTASWLIKSDQSGKYRINVSAQGMMMPFDVPVSALFSVEKEFAADGDGLVIYVYAESCAYIGETYYVQYAIYNGTGKNLYNFTTTMGDFHYEEERVEVTVKTDPFSDGIKFSSLGDGQSPQIYYILDSTGCGTCTLTYGSENYTVNIFPAGETLYGTYSCIFQAEGDPETEYYKLVKAIVDTVGDETGVKVVLQTMPSHITKYNLRVIDLGMLYGDPIDVTTGAYLDSIGVTQATGGSNISLDLNYNSMMTANSGVLGNGWNHSYQEHIDDKNGVIYYYATPDQRTTFVNDDMKQGIVYGTLLEDGKTVIVDGSVKYTGRFSTEEQGLSDYYFIRNNDGTCCLYTPDGEVKNFDEQGRLCKIKNSMGNTVSLTYEDNRTIICDDVTGSRIILFNNEEGYLTEIKDGLGNTAKLTYENGLLAGYTDFAGYTVLYEYDANNRLVKKTSIDQVLTNIYDEKGRVLSQTNGNGTIAMQFEDGADYHKTTLTDYQGNISVVETDGNYNRMAYTDALGNKTTYAYDENGNLIKETDSLGNTKTYEFNELGYVEKLTDENGNVTTLSYDEAGNILSVQSINGTSSYNYDSADRLTQTKYANGRIRQYTYDENGYLAEDAIEGLGSQKYHFVDGMLESVTDTLGNTTTMEYDAMGQLTASTDALKNTTGYTYDSMGRTESITNALGYTLRFEYDYSGNITRTVYPDGSFTASTYDVNNLVTSTTDRAGNVTKYTRDSSGNLLKKEYADGTFEVYEYDALGNVLSETDISGRTTTYTYDSVNRLTSVNDPDGNSVFYEYYNTGKLKKKIVSDGTWESYSYDNAGNLTEVTNNMGTTCYTYDIMGNMTSVTDSCGVTVSYGYDRYDRLVSETDGNGNITRYAYNAAGNCIGKTMPDGTHIKMTYDALGQMTSVSTVTQTYGEVAVRYEYDALGRVVKTIDELGAVSICEYDAFGNLTAVYDGNGNKQAAYTYDLLGNVLTETDADGNVTAGTYNRTGQLVRLVYNINTSNEAAYEYAYDTAGRLLSVTDPLAGVSSYAYDPAGNVASVTDPDGGVTSYTYDPMGRITDICNAVGSTKHYTYDENGLLSESENARGQQTAYEYDALGRVVKTTDELGTAEYFYDNNGNTLSITETLADGTTRIISRTYDCMNRVASYTDYKGNTVNYGYDELGNLITLTYAGGEIVRYAYYPNGLLKSVTDVKGNVTSYEYDSKGNVTKTTFADGTTETRSYSSNRLTVQETVNAAGAVLNRYEYAYDENGNVTKTTGIDYGDIGKVTGAEYKYDAANRLISYNGKEVKYDADGNMIYGPLDGEMVYYEYDCRNRLVKAGDTTYEYDAENNRIAVNTPQYREEYLVNSNAELTQVLTATRYEKTDSGYAKAGVTTAYTYGVGLVSQYTEKDGTEYYHFNNIGSTMYLTRNGVKTHEFAYSTYGELTLGEYGEIRFLYNGQYGVAADDNGLYYMRARYYNPEIRRFINQDILTGSIENSQSLNRYAYCQGNPVNYLDPFGLEPCNFFSGLGHTVLNLLGLIPGAGDVFDITNAIWYIAEGRIDKAIEAGIAALPFVGNFMPDTGLFRYFKRGLNLVSYGGTGFLAGQGMWEGGQALWEEINSKNCSGWRIAGNIVGIGLNGVSLFFSGKGFISETKTLNKMLKDDGVYDWLNNIKSGSNTKSIGTEIEVLLSQRPELTGTNREKLLAIVQNPKLSNIVNELYRPGAYIGDGGTASALMSEFYAGESKHLEKAIGRLIELNKLAKINNLSLSDLDVLDALRIDLENAIHLFE